MKLSEHEIKKVLFSAEEIKTRVAELGKILTEDYKNKNPLSTYHLLCQSLYSSCFQNGDRLFATYHLIYHLSPANLDKIYCKRKR